MLTLPIYKRENIYYLHIRFDGVQIKRSLKTTDAHTATLRAIWLLKVLYMTKPKITDFDFGKEAIRKYEADFSTGKMKADGADDHARMMEAMKLWQSTQQKPTPKPAAENPSPSPAKAGLKLSGLLSKFLLLRKNLSDATKKGYAADLKEFEEFLKYPYIENITHDDVSRYQEWLAKKGSGTSTIDKKVGVIRAVLNFGIKHHYIFGANPASNKNILSKKQKRERGSDFWELEQIVLLVNSNQFQSMKQDAPDFFYILLLGVLTGIRVSALASLEKQDLRVTENNFPFVRIRKDKTYAGMRDVPIPKQLFSELLNFAADKEKIFGFTKREDGKGSSDPIRKILNPLKEELGITGKLTFHGFRKFFNNWMMEQDVSLEARCQMVGHDIENVNVAIYGKKFSVEKLAQLVNPAQEKLLTKLKM